MTSSAKKKLSVTIKVTIIVLAYLFIYRSINNKAELKQFTFLIGQLHSAAVYYTLVALVVLMLVNWLLEAFKWRFLTRRLQRMTPWQAIEAVFCGLTWAIFTPNRLGEYGGRVLFLPPHKRVYGAVTMAIGAFGQNVLTNTLGSIAFIWFLYTFSPVNIIVRVLLTIFLISLAILMVTCYFHMSWIVTFLNKIRPLQKFERFFKILGQYPKPDLLKVLLFCIARFAVFSSEYYLVLHLVLPGLKWLPVMLMVFNMFFVQSALPTLDLIDVGLRGTTATVFFGYITNQKVAVIAAVSSIWFVNLIVPAILGSFFVLKIKFFDRNN